jgi:Transglycosylase SLT domain
MAVRSIIDVEIRDSAFQRFQAQFADYQKKLASTPAAWRNVAQEQSKGAKAFQDQATAIGQSTNQLKSFAAAQDAAARNARTTADSWRQLSMSTKTTAANITSATLSLAKWTGLVGAFGGLVGVAGGLFGIERLAQGVASGRQGAMGLGLGYGEQKGFQNAFGRVVDTDSFLASINQQMHSAGGKASLFGALGPGANLSGSTADVAVRVLEHARALAKSTNPQFDAETMKAHGLDQSMSLQDFQRLRATSDAEFADLKRRNTSGATAFGVDSRTQLAYQNFVTTLDAAGTNIQNAFVVGVGHLIPGLEKLSTAAVHVVDAFLHAPALQKWLDQAGAGLEKFAGYVGTDEFADKVKTFVERIGDAADWLSEHLAWFQSPDKGGAHMSDRVRAGHQLAGEKDIADIKSGGKPGTIAGALKSAFNPGGMSFDQLVALIAKKEGGTTGKANPWGAIGKYQIKEGTAREFGIDPRTLYTAEGNEAAARKILATYAKRFDGNLTEILAAYNQGSGAGNVFRRSGDNPATLKPEGQKYIRGSQGVHVTIENAAGSSFVTQTNMNAAGFPGY